MLILFAHGSFLLQPTYPEAVATIQYDRDNKAIEFPMTQMMIARFPLTVHCADKAGFTLYHHAVVREVRYDFS